MKYRRNKPKEALFPWKIWVEFPGVSVVKNPPVNAGDLGYMGSVPGSGRSPGEENGNPLQCSCLDNPMGRRIWWGAVHGVTKESDMTEQINTHTLCAHTRVCTCTCAHTCAHMHTHLHTHAHTVGRDIDKSWLHHGHQWHQTCSVTVTLEEPKPPTTWRQGRWGLSGKLLI